MSGLQTLWGRGAAARIMLALAVTMAAVLQPNQCLAEDRGARIGVLAYRGTDVALARWRPLADYLSAEIPGWRFGIVPVTLVSAGELLQAGALDFIATNPGHFVTLAKRFPLSVLATRETREAGEETGRLRFGAAIITRADRSDLQTLSDLKGSTLAAVSREAFGGFQIGWYEFRDQGIDAFADLKEIRYTGFPQDLIVEEVLSGAADAGVVRGGLLEIMAREGRLTLSDVKVLLPNAQMGYPYRVSSRLYPEWPMAVRAGTDKSLAEQVTVALLKTQDKVLAGRHGLTDLWSAPLSYDVVRAVISAYHTRDGGPVPATQKPVLDRLWLTVVAALLALLAGLGLGMVLRSRSGAGRAPGIAKTVSAKEVARRERFENLTRREREILSLICRGEPTKAIAGKLNISPKTVEYHRANLLHKTKARSTPRMVQLATRFGFDQVPTLGETT
ncbi:MAG: PhnD/SsuA/transferrin family substrate-binding protein [Pirellulales bacterium]|nr:PhnD/SsuA/transferrin family substrate-binding protein [Pirellulales bacterium]